MKNSSSKKKPNTTNDEASRLSKQLDRADSSSHAQISSDQSEGWELIWEGVSQNFYFRDHYTGAIQSGIIRVPELEVDPTISTSQPPENEIRINSLPIRNSPNQTQMQDALEVALINDYKSAIPQLLEYSIDLITIFSSDAKTQTPLEWATEHEDLDLVELFLSKGADVNFTSATFTRNPALIKAVEKANQRLVKILVPKTN
ncbi:hypothetical protein SS1G_03525 [Sclerotinia sclerotiorum 1980 UF-70]|uniref:Uncharacterized protein n=1 Tax=Sclerotinia sclerotiorum (strain ATCC 18683 / 1980 / Ss-1) TaxID=665079 RepID=A7EDY5_SCLS1|nr:hypothetical protein SS1G_03525 [Sclerotinia sclerotiorum 1980 UF-70]EDO01051.1 hypothetical protein SS1G_03525 [Sclerotinia sclerotiorum 1980 UF-70]